MTFEVREARPEEYEEAGRVTAEAYLEFAVPGGSDWPAYLARIADIGERASRTTILVAVEDGRILGSLTLELEDRVADWDDDPPLRAGEAHIRMLGVDPAARVRGVGAGLMRGAEARARAAGKTYVSLHTTEKMVAAQKMYASLGYERSPDHVFPDGFVLLGYRKELDATSSS
jgi:ribosomal protein S18 acetylase RimI-like enzyme